MIWFRPSVGETRPCTSVLHDAAETVSTGLNAFVCSAVVGRVCQCKISAKYGRSVTIRLHIQEMIRQHNSFFYYVNIYVRLHVSTIQVVIVRSLIEITGLQKAAHTFWDPN